MEKNRKLRQSKMETDNQLNEISLAEAVKLVDFDDEIGSMVHPTFSKNKGIILQFINHNCVDSATIIGGMRLPFDKPAELHRYLKAHQNQIKEHAIAALHRHLVDCQNPAGVNESLTVEDYSLTYMVASVSDLGRKLHPTGRQEGPIFYLQSPALYEYVPMRWGWNATNTENIVVENALFINCYVHLSEAHRRRRVVESKPVAKAPPPKRPFLNLQEGGDYVRRNKSLSPHLMQAIESSIEKILNKSLSQLNVAPMSTASSVGTVTGFAPLTELPDDY